MNPQPDPNLPQPNPQPPTWPEQPSPPPPPPIPQPIAMPQPLQPTVVPQQSYPPAQPPISPPIATPQQPYPSPPTANMPNQPYPPLQPPTPMANSNDDIRSLGILSVVLAFLAAPGGLVVALIGKAKAKKHRQVTGMPAQGESLLKTGLICSIVMLVLIVISVGSLATWLAKHSSAGNLIGTWQCMSFENLSLSSFDDKMTFTDDNQYRFNIDGVARTGTYTIQPSTLNEPAWRSMKPTLQSYYNITDEDPETHILELDNGTAFTAIILNKTTGGRMMWVYAEVNNYICQNDPTEAPLGLLREQTLNQARQ